MSVVRALALPARLIRRSRSIPPLWKGAGVGRDNWRFAGGSRTHGRTLERQNGGEILTDAADPAVGYGYRSTQPHFGHHPPLSELRISSLHRSRQVSAGVSHTFGATFQPSLCWVRADPAYVLGEGVALLSAKVQAAESLTLISSKSKRAFRCLWTMS